MPMLGCVFWGALFSPLFPQWRFYGEFFSVDIAGHVLKNYFSVGSSQLLLYLLCVAGSGQ